MTHSQFSDKKMFFVTLHKALRKNAFQCTVLTLLTSLALNAENITTLINLHYYSNTDYLSDVIASSMKLRYCIGTSWIDLLAVAGIMLVYGISALLYVLYNFRFMHTKKTVNVYYSLGIKRQTLFAGKFAGCALSQLIAVFVPFAVCFAMNVHLYGFSTELLNACICYSLYLAAVALYPLAVAVFSMSRTGSTVEGMICGIVLTFAPTILFYGTFLYSEVFLAGTCFDLRVYFKDTTDFFVSSFGGKLSVINLFYPFIVQSFENSLALMVTDPVNLPSFAYPLFYLGLFVAFTAAACMSFAKQKTENAGFLASSPKLLAATLFFAGVILIPAVAVIGNGNYFASAACAVICFLLCGVAFGLYVGIIALLLRSKEKVKAQLRTGGIVAGALAVFLLVFLTGGFGYENRIPDADKIVSAGITFSAGEGAVMAEGSYAYTYIENCSYHDEDTTDGKIRFLQQNLGSTYIWGSSSYVEFKDPDAVETIRSIHASLLKDRVNRRADTWNETMLICYTLKNGSTVTRSYRRWTPESLILLRELLLTNEYRAACAEYIVKQKGCTTFLYSKNCTTETNLLTVTQNASRVLTELYDALCDDILQGNLPMDFVSSDTPSGYIGISRQATDGVTFTQRLTDYVAADSVMLIPVTSSMKATLAVLEKADLMRYFEDARQPVRAVIYPCPFNDEVFFNSYKHFVQSYQFNGFVVNSEYWGEKLTTEERLHSSRLPTGAITVTDEDLLNQLCANTSFSYYINEPGYFAELHYENENSYTRTDAFVYIPMERIPDELK